MKISLIPELEKFVEEIVAIGRYNSASGVVRASLRILEEEENWKAYAQAKIAKGLEDVAAGRIVTEQQLLEHRNSGGQSGRERYHLSAGKTSLISFVFSIISRQEANGPPRRWNVDSSSPLSTQANGPGRATPARNYTIHV